MKLLPAVLAASLTVSSYSADYLVAVPETTASDADWSRKADAQHIIDTREPLVIQRALTTTGIAKSSASSPCA